MSQTITITIDKRPVTLTAKDVGELVLIARDIGRDESQFFNHSMSDYEKDWRKRLTNWLDNHGPDVVDQVSETIEIDERLPHCFMWIVKLVTGQLTHTGEQRECMRHCCGFASQAITDDQWHRETEAALKAVCDDPDRLMGNDRALIRKLALKLCECYRFGPINHRPEPAEGKDAQT